MKAVVFVLKLKVAGLVTVRTSHHLQSACSVARRGQALYSLRLMGSSHQPSEVS